MFICCYTGWWVKNLVPGSFHPEVRAALEHWRPLRCQWKLCTAGARCRNPMNPWNGGYNQQGKPWKTNIMWVWRKPQSIVWQCTCFCTCNSSRTLLYMLMESCGLQEVTRRSCSCSVSISRQTTDWLQSKEVSLVWLDLLDLVVGLVGSRPHHQVGS